MLDLGEVEALRLKVQFRAAVGLTASLTSARRGESINTKIFWGARR